MLGSVLWDVYNLAQPKVRRSIYICEYIDFVEEGRHWFCAVTVASPLSELVSSLACMLCNLSFPLAAEEMSVFMNCTCWVIHECDPFDTSLHNFAFV